MEFVDVGVEVGLENFLAAKITLDSHYYNIIMLRGFALLLTHLLFGSLETGIDYIQLHRCACVYGIEGYALAGCQNEDLVGLTLRYCENLQLVKRDLLNP